MAIGVILQKLWSAWSIRSLMIVSLITQIVLAYAAPYRRKSSRSWTTITVWSTYLLADWITIYIFGLISSSVRGSFVTPLEVNQDILGLWASFLLFHLGGPDTITAYSLEDNSLWLRHLIRFVGQLAVFSYIFLKTIPGNNLVVPTALVLATGFIKNWERARALFLASLDSLKSSVIERPIYNLPMPRFIMEVYFFQIFKGMIVDIMPSPSELQESHEFFMGQSASDALDVISGELSLMYAVLYTKTLAIYSVRGTVSRSIFYVNMAAALVLFCLSSKDQFDRVDVRITYCLLVGVFVVDLSRGMMLSNAHWFISESALRYRSVMLLWNLTSIPNTLIKGFCSCITGSYRSLGFESMGEFNLLECSIQKYSHSRKMRKNKVTRFCGDLLDKAIDRCGLTNRLDEIVHTRKKPFNDLIWNFISNELQKKASSISDEGQAREIYESKGEFVLRGSNRHQLKNYMEDFDYDNGLLCWHMATEICYNTDEGQDDHNREWSKVLSDYLMYLLIFRPKMMAPVAGLAQRRYADTCREVKELASISGADNLKEFCAEVLIDMAKVEDDGPDPEKGEVRSSRGCDQEEQNDEKCGSVGKEMSVLSDGCRLARTLRNSADKWETIASVWVEMLSYAAGHCRPDSLVRTVAEGGELLTHVWLLMAHLGIMAQWRK